MRQPQMDKLTDKDLQFVCFAVRGKADRMREMIADGVVSPLAIRESLPLAARKGRTDACHVLLAEGAEPYHVNWGNKSAVQFAFEEGRWETLQLLDPNKYDKTADYRLSDNDKRLHSGVRKCEVDKVRSAIADGANANCISSRLGHVLQQAMRPSQLQIVRLLVDAGADVNYVNPHSGNSIIDLARRDADADIVEYLRKQGAVSGSGPPDRLFDDIPERLERANSTICKQLDHVLNVMVPAQRGT